MLKWAPGLIILLFIISINLEYKLNPANQSTNFRKAKEGSQYYISKARKSSFYLWLLNQILWRAIPFNNPHKFIINKIEDDGLSLRIPFIRHNLNHIKGLHACAQATAAEYITGLTLMYLLGNSKYRMVMQKLEIEYHYQGKTAANVSYSLSKDWIKQNIEIPVENEGVAIVTCIVEIDDNSGNKLSTSKIRWHFKPWDKVNTSL